MIVVNERFITLNEEKGQEIIMKNFKMGIIVTLLCVLVFGKSLTAHAEESNVSIKTPEEIQALLSSDDYESLKSSGIIKEDNDNSNPRASETAIGLGYGRDWKGDFVEIRVTGVSTGIVTIQLKLTVYHVPKEGAPYYTDHDVSFYQAVLYDQKQRFYFNDWKSAGIQGYAYFSNGNSEPIPFTMVVNGQ